MALIRRIFTLVGNFSFIIAIGIMVFLSISISVEVFLRYVVGSSSIWVTEVSGYLVAGVLFMSMAKIYREGGHVSMSILTDKVSPKVHKICTVLAHLCVLVFAIILFWTTLEMTNLSYSFNWKSSTILAVPLYIPQALMPIGSMVFIIEIVNKLLGEFISSENCKDNKVEGAL